MKKLAGLALILTAILSAPACSHPSTRAVDRGAETRLGSVRKPASVSDYERELLELYIGMAYVDTNNWLRGRVEVDGVEFRPRIGFDTDRWAIKLVRQLAPALSKFQAFQGTVYRGVRSGDFLNGLKEGGLFTDQAFMSTSSDRQSAEVFTHPENLPKEEWTDENSGPLMIIESQSGRDIRAVNEHEKEILFAPGTVFEVGKITRGSTGKILEMRFKEVLPDQLTDSQRKALKQSRDSAIQAELVRLYGSKPLKSSQFKQDLAAAKKFWKEMNSSGWLDALDLTREAYEAVFGDGG